MPGDLQAVPADDAPPASLKRLAYWSSWKKDPHLDFLLRTHRATLEEVDFRQDRQEVPGCAVTPALLAALPMLRELRCCLLADMTPLLQCANLR